MTRIKGTPIKSKKMELVQMKVGTKSCSVHKTTLNQIKQLQKSTKLCIPKLPFSRVIREILMEFGQNDSRIEAAALSALQEAAEAFLVQLFEDSNLCAIHARRLTVRPNDMRLVKELLKRNV